MRLLSLKARAWMGFRDLDLPFEGLDQVVITGPNDHGKSSILDALTWCLVEQVVRPSVLARQADQFIHEGADLMWVEVGFATSRGEVVSVRREKPRGKTATLGLSVNGEDRRGHKIEDTQARIIALLGLPADALLAGPIMVQGEADRFMRSTPGDRKDLLVKLLGLDLYDRLFRVAKGRREEAEREDAVARARLEETASVAARRESVAPQLDVARRDLAAAQEAAERAAERLTAAKVELAKVETLGANTSSLEQRENSLRAILDRYPDRIAGTRARIDRAEAFLSEPAPPPNEVEVIEAATVDAAKQRVADGRADRTLYIELRAKVDRFRERLHEAEGRRLIVAEVPCHAEGEFASCRFLTEVPTEAMLDEGRRKLKLGEGQVEELRTAQAFVDQWEADYERLYAGRQAYISELGQRERVQLDWERRRDEATEELTRLRAIVDQDETQLAAARTEHVAVMTELAAAREALSGQQAAQRAVTGAEQALSAARQHASRQEPETRRLEGELRLIEEAEGVLEDRRSEAEATMARLATYRTLEGAWHRDGVPTAIIEHATPLIEARANEVLDRLPESLRVTLRTQRPTKAAGMAETLDVVVTIDGFERTYGLLSFGARFRIDFALRLAIGQVLTHRSGRTIDTLWLDEPLRDLDAEGREAALDTIQALADEFGLVVITSHHAEANDRFPNRINVAKEAGVSTATLA